MNDSTIHNVPFGILELMNCIVDVELLLSYRVTSYLLLVLLMSLRSSRMTDALSRKPLSQTLASRRLPTRSTLNPVPESDRSPSSRGVSPGHSARSYEQFLDGVSPAARSEGTDHLAMTEEPHDIRARMEAELIALRRAQSVFADTHPSVDIHGKLQDLQEMYIGDLLVKDCQISQLKAEVDSLSTAVTSARSSAPSTTPSAGVSGSTTPTNASTLALRVQSLQKSIAQERQRRMDSEAKLDELLRTTDAASRSSSNHKMEVHQLRTRLTSLQETNKRLQDRLSALEVANRELRTHPVDNPSPQVSGAASPAASSCAGGTEKVPYVKFAQLRAEKRQIEAKLNGQIESLKQENSNLVSQRDSEMDKLKDHHRRVILDLERKTRLAETSRTEDSKELRDLQIQFEQVATERDSLQNQLNQVRVKNDSLAQEIDQKINEINELIESEKFLSLELEDREKVISELQLDANVREDLEKLRDEKLDLLERIEEREDMLKSLQDESGENKTAIERLKEKLESKEREIGMMISQAEELDGLLSRADQDVHTSREKLAAVEKELDEVRRSNQAGGNELQKERDKLTADVARLDSLLKATTVNSDTLANQLRDQISVLQREIESLRQGQQAAENRARALNDEKNLLTSKLESVKPNSPKKVTESKISALERELSSMKRAFGQPKKESDDDLTSSLGEDEDDGVTPSPDLPLTENVLKAENMFHDAVDLCAEGSFAEAVALLEQASAILSRLPKGEISRNDPTTLKILESDIYGQLGVAFQSLSQVAEAIEAYMTAVDVDPDAHACHANLAVLLHHQSRLKEAETHAKIAIELAPEIDEYQTLLSQIKTFTPAPAGPTNHNKFRASTNW